MSVRLPLRIPAPRPMRALVRRLRGDNKGLALIEFAISLPIFLGLGMFGVEVAWFAVTSMNVSQISLTIADNAARMGQTASSSSTKSVYRSDVNAIFAGAAKQGEAIDLLQNGRIVLSSLQMIGNSGKQRIRWQRCKGMKNYDSDYGPEGTAETGSSSFAGMGPAGSEIRAQNGEAVMYVEVFYDYEGLFGDMFIDNRTIKYEAAFPIRDDRDLSGTVGNDGAADPTCDVYSVA